MNGSKNDGAAGLLPAERVATSLVGGGLVSVGLGRRTPAGAVAAVVGGALLVRGISGRAVIVPALVRSGSGDDNGAASAQAALARTITIGLPAAALYAAWRDVDKLALVTAGLFDVEAVGQNRLRWTLSGPVGTKFSWDTQYVEDRPGEYLRWRSLSGPQSEGSLRFRPAPARRGTEVTLQLGLKAPGGALGDAALKRFGIVPKLAAGEVLRRFKCLVEAGEIPSLKHNSAARAGGRDD